MSKKNRNDFEDGLVRCKANRIQIKRDRHCYSKNGNIAQWHRCATTIKIHNQRDTFLVPVQKDILAGRFFACSLDSERNFMNSSKTLMNR